MYNDPNQPPPPPPFEQPQTVYGSPPYGVPPVPPVAVYVVPPPPKKSLRWLWITLGIIGGIVVLGCSGCVIVSIISVNSFSQSTSLVTTANLYYQAVRDQQYTIAYSYIDPAGASVSGQTLTRELFVNGAQAIDAQKGVVTSFASSGFSINGNTATVTMQVNRGSQSYTVHLELKKKVATGRLLMLTAFRNTQHNERL